MSDNKPEQEPLPDLDATSEERELPSTAADDPTAMWNEDDLRGAGMDEVAERVKSLPPPAATGPSVGGDARESVVVGNGDADARAPETAPRPRARRTPSAGGLSWSVTIGLAIALGVAVYFLVRMLK